MARHRDGRWEWAAAPGEAPTARYQHAVSFVGTRLHVSGGALGGGSMVDDALSLAVLDTSAGPSAGWTVAEVRAGGSKAAAAAASRRCRHTTAGVGPLVFVCGGLRGGTLLGDMYVSEESPEESGASRAASVAALAEVIDFNAPAWRRWLRDVGLLEEAAKMADRSSRGPGRRRSRRHPPRDGGGAKGVDGGAKGVGGAFGTPQGGSFNVGSPGSADGSPDNNLNQLAKLSSAEAQAAVALANRTNVDIDSPRSRTVRGRNTRRRRREAPPGVRRLRRARRRLPTCGCITARWWWRRVWTGTPPRTRFARATALHRSV